MTKTLLAIMFLLLFASPSLAGLRPNDPAPSFSLISSDGANVSLDHILTGKKDETAGAIVGFFASWCVPCRNELSLIDSLAPELSRKGIRAVMINVKESLAVVKSLVAELKIKNLLVLSDGKGKTAEMFQVRFFPTTFFIRADGTIAAVAYGEITDADELLNGVEKILH